jgi:tetratricopeptide (TPR) repeat protein
MSAREAHSLPELLADEHLFGEKVVEGLLAEGYDRLTEGERRVMEALAVFDRPVEALAINYLLQPWFPHLPAVSILRHLTKTYFVTENRVTEEYNLHPLDRDYIYGQLPHPGRAGAYHRQSLELRAAAFYASIRKHEGEWQAIDDLAPQLAEFEHRLRAEDYDGACHLLNTIDADYLFQWAYYARLIDMRERLTGHLCNPHLQATNLRHLGLAYRGLGQVEEAISRYDQALAITREANDRREEGAALGALGVAYRVQGWIDRAGDTLKQALAIAQEIHDKRNMHDWIGNLGDIHRARGQAAQAIPFYEQAIAITREIGYRRYEGVWLGNLAGAWGAMGEYDRAIERLQEALAIVRDVGDRRAEAKFLNSLGQAYYASGEYDRAEQSYQQALSIERETGNRRGQGHQLLGLARVCLATGRISEAQVHCVDALQLEVAQVEHQAALLLGIARLTGETRDAAQAFVDAVALCRELLNRSAENVTARCDLATALAGQAACDPRWADASERMELLAGALAEYRRALDDASARDLALHPLRDLELIRAAGIEGLAPLFGLLKSASAEGNQEVNPRHWES